MDLNAALTGTKKRLRNNRLGRFVCFSISVLGLFALGSALLFFRGANEGARGLLITSGAAFALSLIYAFNRNFPRLPEAALELDALLKTRNRASSFVEIISKEADADEKAKADFLAFQVEPLLKELNLKSSFPFRLSLKEKTLCLTGALGWIAALILFLKVPQPSLTPFSSAQAQLLSEIAAEPDIPEPLKEKLESLAQEIEDYGLSSDEAKEALSAAEDELGRSKEDAAAKNDKVVKENQAKDSSAKQGLAPTPTPTVTPAPEEKKNQDKKTEQEKESQTDVQNTKEGGKGEKQENKKQDEKSQGEQEKKKGDKDQQGQDGQQSQGQSGKQEKKDKEGQGEGQSENKGGGKSGQDSKEQPGKDQKQGGQGSEKGDQKQGQQGNGQQQEQNGLQKAGQALQQVKENMKQDKQGQQGKQGEKAQAEQAQGKEKAQGQKEGEHDKNAQGGKDGQNKDQKQEGAKDKSGSDKADKEKKGEKKEDSKNADGDKSKEEDKKPKEEKSQQSAQPDKNSSENKKSGEAPMPDRNAGLRESGEGDFKEESGLGKDKEFIEKKVEMKDEKYDTSRTGEASSLTESKGEAEAKTELSEIRQTKPEAVKERLRQPIPLEYEELLR